MVRHQLGRFAAGQGLHAPCSRKEYDSKAIVSMIHKYLLGDGYQVVLMVERWPANLYGRATFCVCDLILSAGKRVSHDLNQLALGRLFECQV